MLNATAAQITSTRVLKRPFDSDAFFNDVLHTTVTSKNSVIQRIWRSTVFSEWLKKAIAQDPEDLIKNASHLKAAKHRFESYATPLGRFVLHIRALLDVIQQVVMQRNGEEATSFKMWLRGIDEEKLITIAMLADAADVILVLTRSLDDESADVASMHDAVHTMIATMEALFVNSKCLAVTGYTKHMVTTLQKHRMIYLKDGLRSIGGDATASYITHCMDRMKKYVALLKEVVKTEFPDWEIFAAFRVFDLHSNERRQSGGTDVVTADEGFLSCFARLARVANVNAEALLSQYTSIRQMALGVKERTGASNKCAWQDAIRMSQKHHGTRQSYPVDALLPVLQKYCAWTAATSGVEQNFSVSTRAVGVYRSSMGDSVSEMCLRFATEKLQDAQKDEIIAKARIIWADYYGPPRQKASTRCDLGMLKVKESSATGTTEASWLRQKRAEAHSVGASACISSEIASDGSDGSDSDSDIKAERKHQRKKRRKLLVEAHLDGLLLPDEITASVKDMADKTIKNNRTLDKKRLRTIKNNNEDQPQTKKDLKLERGSLAYIPGGAQAEPAAQALQQLGIRIQIGGDVPVDACVFITTDPASPQEQVKWIAALRGGIIVSFDALLRPPGPFVKYQCAVASKEMIFITDAFKQKHPKLASLVEAVSQQPGSNWKLTERMKARAVILMRKDEGHIKGLTKKTFLKHFSAINYGASSV